MHWVVKPEDSWRTRTNKIMVLDKSQVRMERGTEMVSSIHLALHPIQENPHTAGATVVNVRRQNACWSCLAIMLCKLMQWTTYVHLRWTLTRNTTRKLILVSILTNTAGMQIVWSKSPLPGDKSFIYQEFIWNKPTFFIVFPAILTICTTCADHCSSQVHIDPKQLTLLASIQILIKLKLLFHCQTDSWHHHSDVGKNRSLRHWKASS